MGLPRRARLSRRRDIEAVRRLGRRVSGRSGTVWSRPNGAEHSRLCVICPRRLGTAVQRNRIRRRVQVALMAVTGELEGAWDIVWRAEAGQVVATADALASEVVRMLQRAGMMEPSGHGGGR